MQGVLLGGRYQILEVLRAGGFGQTYIAEDTQRPGNPRCLVKQLKPGRNDEAFMQVTRRLFNTEAEILEKLGQHDQIPLLLAYFEENQEFYLVQEFIIGQTLSDELAREKHFSEPKVIRLLRDALGILEFVHSQKVIHRDIKPQNLIRRHQDGKLVLIDFGAVKEIGNPLVGDVGEVDETGMTVAVGTRGYMPGEQLVGKPRFNSDIYALGMTAIQSLTGVRPAKFMDDPYTSEVIWRDRVQVSDRLGAILDKMIRYDFRDRYQSVTEVLQDLQPASKQSSVTLSLPLKLPTRLSTLPLGNTDLKTVQQQAKRVWKQGLKAGPLSELRRSFKNFKRQTRHRSWQQNLLWGLQTIAAGPLGAVVVTLIVTGLIQGVRYSGRLQPLELAMFDRMVQQQPPEENDPRLLVVAIAETDLEQQQWPLSQETVAQLLKKLQKYKAYAIGLNLDLTLLKEPGQAALVEELKKNNVIMTRDIEKTQDNTALPVRSRERTSFSNIPIDSDGIVRRTWLFTNPGEGIIYSLPFSLALAYLTTLPKYTIIEGIPGYTVNEDLPNFAQIEPSSAQNNDANPDFVQMGTAVFRPLATDSGGYQNIDIQGYQSLLNYRSTDSVDSIAREVTLTQILTNQFDPDWVKDKAVIVGPTAPSIDTLLLTPYQNDGQPLKLSQTRLHAQMLSQILSGALDSRPLFQFWSGGTELWWIFGWGLTGGILAWFGRRYLILGLGGAALLGILFYSYYSNFNQQKWIPLVAPAINLTTTAGIVTIWRIVQAKQQQQKLHPDESILTAAKENNADPPTGMEYLSAAEITASNDQPALLSGIDSRVQPTGMDYLAAADNSHSAAAMTGLEDFSLDAIAEDNRPNPLTILDDTEPERGVASHPPTTLEAPAAEDRYAVNRNPTMLDFPTAAEDSTDPPTVLDAIGEGNDPEQPTELDFPVTVQQGNTDPPTVVEYPAAIADRQPEETAAKVEVPPAVRQRIHLQPGSAGMMVRGTLAPNQRHYYLLHSTDEKFLSIQVVTGAVNLVVFDPENQVIGAIAKDRERWQDWLTNAGDYSIGVTTTVAEEYAISLELADEESTLKDDTVPVSASFGRLKNAAKQNRIRSLLEPNEVKSYQFTCRQGQRLTVQVLEGEVQLSAIAPDGRKIQAKVGGAKQWRSALPATGKYTVEVAALSASAVRLYVV